MTPGWNVYFDNLSILHYSSPLIEENNYYRYGLAMAAISDKAIKTQYAENRYRYNGKELQHQEFADGTGWEEYDYGARFQDPQIGRFIIQDPLTDLCYNTSYSYCFNNPLKFKDVNGLYASESLEDWSDRMGKKHHTGNSDEYEDAISEDYQAQTSNSLQNGINEATPVMSR